MVIELVWVEVGYMVAGVVEVGLVVVQVVIAENMNFLVDSAGIVDKERVVVGIGKSIGMAIGMDYFHKNILSNLEDVGFGSAEEDNFSKA